MEEHIKLLAQHLDREQFEVFAICPDWQATASFTEAMRSAADTVAVITPDRRHGLQAQCREAFRLYRQLRAWRIQVMHMHSTTFYGQQLTLLIARLARVEHVYMTEHLAPEAPLIWHQRLLRNLCSLMVDGIVCVSQKNFLARAAHILTPANRTIVVNNGVDLKRFTPISDQDMAAIRSQYGIPPDAPIVGTAVRFEPEKGLQYLIDAMPAILTSCPKAHFLMVGDGSLRAELEASVEHLGISDRVHFTGFQRDPRAFLALMDAFVLPVPVGSMSIGLLEAMAMERAVVMTFGGEGEAVIHGESGFCAEPRSAVSIATYVSQILASADVQRKLGQAARKRVATSFSAQSVAEALSQLYRKGAGQRPVRPEQPQTTHIANM
jgi:glycosyltransferase involved in cell wall biosynthesis